MPTALTERREDDTQSLFPEFILLSPKRWDEGNDCSVELFFTNEEVERFIKINDDYFLFDSFVPISRIIKIYFNDREKGETVMWNIRSGAGFFPENRINYELDKSNEVAILPQIELRKNERFGEVQKNHSRFNRLLGGIAFMRVALKEISDNKINYPVNYISVISYFNQHILDNFNAIDIYKDLSLHKVLLPSNPILKFIGKEISNEIIENEAKNENVRLEKKIGSIYNLNIIPYNTNTYKLCVLKTYGKSNSKSIDDFIVEFYKGNDNEKNEEIALLFGIHNGYQNLRNYYKINERKVNVKFELETKLDYYIIESIYQYVTNNSTAFNNFNFINEYIEFKSITPSIELDYLQYQLFDTIISTKKRDYSEYLQVLVKGIVQELEQFFPKDLISINSEKMVVHFSKKIKTNFEELVETIKKEKTNRDNISINNSISNVKSEEKKEHNNEKSQENCYAENLVSDGFLPLSFKDYIPQIKASKGIKQLRDIAKRIGITIPSELKTIKQIQTFLLEKLSK